jgi:aspartyl-tRNA(Asn)/glutamyl-tRNA(Gln) amidotransferase subunit A
MISVVPSIEQIAGQIKSGAVSPVELVRRCLDRIEARLELNAFITVMADSAVSAAQVAEREITSGHYRGPLHGVPVSVKDLIDVAGTPTTSGSAVPPRLATSDASIVARLRDAGAIIIGKTNLHEFAFGTTSEESAFGPVHHPKDLSRSAGGSSGGAAVALVEGMCFGSVGTDTGGSIRIPSAVCGTVGLKPMLGELPCDGVVPLSTTLDHVGPMARSVADVAVMFDAMRSEVAGGVIDSPSPRPYVFGVPEAYFCDRLDRGVRAALMVPRSHARDACRPLFPGRPAASGNGSVHPR